MKVEYRRDIQNSYLVLIAENHEVEKSYDLRMIIENQIEGLLSCERKLMNNDILYYYNVTSKISLEDRCRAKKIQGQEILLLLNRILGILDKLEEYLLSEKSLCLIPQYIYMDDSMEQIQFCYVPGENWDFQVQLRELMEYLLPCLNHENQESMIVGYGLYHYILRERVTIEGLHEQLNLYHKKSKESISEIEIKEKEATQRNLIVPKEEEDWQEIGENAAEMQRENDSKREYGYYHLGAVILLLWVLCGWFLWRNFPVFLCMWGIVGIVLIGITILVFLKWKKVTQKSISEKIEQEEEIEQDEVYTQILSTEWNRKKYILKSDKETILLYNKDYYIIGRDEKLADVVLRSVAVSRKHAKIRIENMHCFLIDLYSKNGICVNGVRMKEGEERELFGGEWIEFADVGYHFQQEN